MNAVSFATKGLLEMAAGAKIADITTIMDQLYEDVVDRGLRYLSKYYILYTICK